MNVIMSNLPPGGASEETPDRTHFLDGKMDIVPFKILEEKASLEEKISDASIPNALDSMTVSCVSSLILLNY